MTHPVARQSASPVLTLSASEGCHQDELSPSLPDRLGVEGPLTAYGFTYW